MTMSMTEIDKALRQLRLSGVRATLETRILEAQAANLSFLETFSTILQDELDRRQSRLLERRYQLSGLDERASLAEFDWGYNPKIPKRACFELHTLKFVAEGDSGLLIGPPGDPCGRYTSLHKLALCHLEPRSGKFNDASLICASTWVK